LKREGEHKETGGKFSAEEFSTEENSRVKIHFPNYSLKRLLFFLVTLPILFWGLKKVVTHLAICVSQVSGVARRIRLPALLASKLPGSASDLKASSSEGYLEEREKKRMG